MSRPNQKTSVNTIERLLVAGACVLALVLGFANLGKPSLWHDELVHVYVAKSIAAGDGPRLPSGNVYTSGTAYNYLLAGFVAVFGDGEVATRAPAVLCSAINVLLVYALLRPLLGPAPALVAAFSLALSPWCVGWARQARFYALQQTAYLLFVWASWRLHARIGAGVPWKSIAALMASYVLGILSSFHSILALAAFGAHAAIECVTEKRTRIRWFVAGVVCVLVGAATLGFYVASFSAIDYQVLTQTSAVGGTLPSPEENRDHSDRYFYFRFLMNNLSRGYFLLAMIGFASMVAFEGRRGLFVAIAFWAPVLVLTYLIGYRMHRFMFFAYPFYVAAHAYGTVALIRFIRAGSESTTRALASILVVLFLLMIGVSTFRLVGDTLETASGSSITLARRHPEWREPCRFVRDRVDDGIVVVSTTYLPALYYAGRCDEWYPSRYTWPESVESGTEGLNDLAALKSYIERHPRGYFLAEWQRFDRWRHRFLAEDVEWVQRHLHRIPKASNQDITLYAWGEVPHE